MNRWSVSNPAVRRIMKEMQDLEQNPSDLFWARPLEEDIFEWHFTLRGPMDTPFERGLYHGRLQLPTDWPFKPPDIYFLTPSGRFELNTKICLSITSYHPESYQIVTIRQVLEAVIVHFCEEGNGSIGAVLATPERRKELALQSWNWSLPPREESQTDVVSSSSNPSEPSPPPPPPPPPPRSASPVSAPSPALVPAPAHQKLAADEDADRTPLNGPLPSPFPEPLVSPEHHREDTLGRLLHSARFSRSCPAMVSSLFPDPLDGALWLALTTLAFLMVSNLVMIMWV